MDISNGYDLDVVRALTNILSLNIDSPPSKALELDVINALRDKIPKL